MANIKEIVLPTMTIHFGYLDDALSALLHTILFVRAPSIVAPRDHAANSLKPLVYVCCGPESVDRTVNSTLDVFRKALVWNDNGLYSGEVVVSFFDKRETKEFLGFVTKQEKIYFERWKLSIDLIDATHQGQQATSQVDAYQSAYSQVCQNVLFILEAVNGATDHVPLSVYDYDIQVPERHLETGSERGLVAKLINSPAIFNSMS